LEDVKRKDRSIRPYLKIFSDGKSEIHFTFTDGHPANEPENSVYYIKYKKGEFLKANGIRVGTLADLPIRQSRSDLVYDGKAEKIRSWIWDIALNEKNNPVIVYTRLPQKTDHRYNYAYWNGDVWIDAEITRGGKWFPKTPIYSKEREPYYSGGIAINHADSSVIYISRQIDHTFEIEKWVTGDRGKSWSAMAITDHSTSDNVRPVVPRGYKGHQDHVLWMRGDYIHYTDYHTGIWLLVPKHSAARQRVPTDAGAVHRGLPL
jgi:hypothetical protein